MAFTFTKVIDDSVNGVSYYTATTDTSSAAGTISPGFEPNEVTVIDITTPNTYRWIKGMAAASMNKVAAAGTQTNPSSNGITVTAAGSSTGPTVTLGTGVHTNSCSYVIALRR